MAEVSAQLLDGGEGRCALAGALTLETAAGLWHRLKAAGLLAGAREADLAGVTDADSAGVALLLAWRASCMAAGGQLGFRSLPSRVLALAQLTGAAPALGIGSARGRDPA